jgi:hypothetical protein
MFLILEGMLKFVYTLWMPLLLMEDSGGCGDRFGEPIGAETASPINAALRRAC